MKKYLSLLILFSFVLLNADFDIMNSPVTGFMHNDLNVSAGSDIFGYSASAIYSKEGNAMGFAAGFRAELFDGIEITALPDSLEEISANNIPYVASTVNLYSISVPAGVVVHRGQYDIWLADIFTTGSLYEASYFSNRINGGIEYGSSSMKAYLAMYSLTGDYAFYKGSMYVTAGQKAVLMVLSSVYKDTGRNIYAGMKLHAGFSADMKYALERDKYGVTPCINAVIEGDVNADLEFGGNLFSITMGIDKESYSISAGYKNTAGLSSLNFSTGFNF